MGIDRDAIRKHLENMPEKQTGFDREAVASELPEDRQSEPSEPEGPGLLERNVNSAKNINTALVNALYFPFDLIHNIESSVRSMTGLELPEGVERAEAPGTRAQQTLSEQGITFAPGEEPDDPVSRGMRFATETLLPVGLATRAASIPRAIQREGASSIQGARGAGPGAPRSTAQAGAQQVTEDLATRPGRAAAAEGTVAAGAPAAGAQLEQSAAEGNVPLDRQSARAFGELLGGLGIGIGTSLAGSAGRGTARVAGGLGRGGVNVGERLPVSGQIIRFIRNNMSSFEAGHKRVSQFTDDPEATAQAAETGDTRMTPAERADQPGLARLQRTAEESDPATRRQQMERRRETGRQMEAERRGEFGAPREAQNFLRRRVQAAVKNMERRFNQLRTDADPEDQARIVGDEIEQAHVDARAREREKWGSLNVDEPVNIASVHQDYEQLLTNEPAADQLPGFVRRKLGGIVENEDGEEVFRPGELGTDPSFNELKTLRSQILRTERQMERGSEADRNQLRLLGRLDDMVLDAMREIDRDEVDNAIGLSRLVNQTFRHGQVGELRRRRVTQDRPSQTLEQSMQGGPAARAEKVRDLLRSAEQADDPQAASRTRRAVEEYMKNMFVTQVDPDGNGVPKERDVRRFVRQNRELLKEFPELAKRMQNVASARELVRQRSGEIGNQILPWQRRKASTALYVEADPGREIAKITAPNNGVDPETGFRSLVQDVRQGPKAAYEGLQGAFVEHLFDVSRRNVEEGLELSGERFLSEVERLGEPAVRAGLITREQLQRLRTTGRNLRAMERVETEPALSEGIQPSGPGNWLRTTLGMLGAAGGRKVADVTGSRATIQFAQRGSRFAEQAGRSQLVDRSEELIKQALLKDPQLFRRITTDLPSASPRTRQRIERTVRPFFSVGVAAENQGEDRQQAAGAER